MSSRTGESVPAELHGGRVEGAFVVLGVALGGGDALGAGFIQTGTSSCPKSEVRPSSPPGMVAYCSSLVRESAMSRFRMLSWPMRSSGPNAAFSVRSMESLSG